MIAALIGGVDRAFPSFTSELPLRVSGRDWWGVLTGD
jgi:hypothetical protein